jgi:hypothetical protein
MAVRYHRNTLVLLVLGAATAAEAQVQPEIAKRYFEEATKLCERDAGRLWGVPHDYKSRRHHRAVNPGFA